jgi:hypothetical protein
MPFINFISALLLTINLFSCRQRSFIDVRDELRQNFSKIGARQEAEYNLLDSIEAIARRDKRFALSLIQEALYSDSLEYIRSDLHFLRGTIFHDIDSFEIAKYEFTIGSWPAVTPRLLKFRARSSLKLNQVASALADLRESLSFDSSSNREIGNLFEVLHEKDSAIFYYQQVSPSSEKTFLVSKERILELNKQHPVFLTELNIDSFPKLRVSFR